jgi:hypothetical protein
MAAGLATAAAVVAVGITWNPFGFAPDLPLGERVSVAIRCVTLPALCLAVAIGRLAKHRFFTPADIDGSGLQPGSARALLLQSILQNTLEQAVLASFAYLAWAVVMPSAWLSTVPLAALAFAVGRVLFFAGYGRGAPSRAVGFTMAFYPSVAMLVSIAIAEVSR